MENPLGFIWWILNAKPERGGARAYSHKVTLYLALVRLDWTRELIVDLCLGSRST